MLSLRDPSVSGDASFEFYWQAGTTDAASGNLVAVANREIGAQTSLRLINPPSPVTQTYLAAAGMAANTNVSRLLEVNDWSNGLEELGNLSTPVNANELCVGHGFGPLVTGNTLNGSIGEVLVFDRRLDTTEVTFVKNYLTQKWLTP